MRETRALVMIGNVPCRIFDEREDANEYVEQLPAERTDAVHVMWPIPVGDRDE